MKKFCALLLMTLVAFSIVSCEEKEIIPLEPEVPGNLSVESVLSAVCNVCEIDSYTQKDNGYVLYFHAPVSVVVDSQGKQTLSELEIPGDLVKQIQDEVSVLNITLNSGKSYVLRYHSYLSVTIDADNLVFSNSETARTVNYAVTSSGKSLKIEFEDLEHFKAIPNKDGDKGTIRFEAISVGDYNETVKVIFSNEKKEVVVPVTLIMNYEGKVDASFSFPEYARIFAVEIPDNDNASIVIADSYRSWISTKVGKSLDEGHSKSMLYILIKENVGKSRRTGTITITNPSANKNYTINISQLGSEMDGSFKKALLDFYDALGGRNWFKRAGDDDDRELHWNKEMQVIDFYGLYPPHTADASTIDSGMSGYVYFGTEDEWEISLPFNGLKGVIPESFWDACKYFTYIKINNCYLQDSRLSDKVWHEKLVGINFSHTYIGGEFTPAMAKARNLQLINFYKGRIKGEFPKEIAGLKQLKYINFKFCDLSGTLPENIGDLSELRELWIHGNLNLSGTLPDSFYELDNLITLEATFTKLGGTISPKIAEMKSIRDVCIECCEFEGTIPEEVGTINKIDFAASGNYFTKLPEYVRYSGADNDWVHMGGTFPCGVPSYQRKKENGRPKDLCSYDYTAIDEMTESTYTDFYPLKGNERSGAFHFDLPIWAHMRYNIVGWERYIVGTEVKKPEWPYAEDLQYPANEYYYDKERKAWCHPKLEYPAREYYKDSRGNWVHDASCPWDQPYIYEE